MDLIYEWDGTPGPSTPTGALDSTLRWFTDRSHQLGEVPADPTGRTAPEDDPVLSMIAIRGLNALIDEAKGIDVAAPQTASIEVSAVTGNGEEFAAATIQPQRSGGYRVEILRVTGFVSDHPDC